MENNHFLYYYIYFELYVTTVVEFGLGFGPVILV